MLLFPPNDNDTAINAIVIVFQVLIIVILCFGIHLLGKHVFAWIFNVPFNLLSDKDKRSTIVEFNNTILTCLLIPFFVAGALKLFRTPEMYLIVVKYFVFNLLSVA